MISSLTTDYAGKTIENSQESDQVKCNGEKEDWGVSSVLECLLAMNGSLGSVWTHKREGVGIGLLESHRQYKKVG